MEFQILGPLRVIGDGGRETAFGGAKPGAVLAMLLLRPNELVPADRLIDDLWEGEPPATAAKTVQVHVSRLRRALGVSELDRVIETTSGGYVLHALPEQIDAMRFERMVEDGSAALAQREYRRTSELMRAALACWRGDALADFTYASFAQDTIARLDGLRTAALEAAIAAELALGLHTKLIPELKFLVKRHPLSEHLRAQLMLALYRSGRQAEALGVYRTTRRILVDQLGIEPSAELRELEHAILAQDPELSAPEQQERIAASPREARRGALVGYEHELTALEELMEEAFAGRGRAALVAGEPGVGKTRLANELATVAQARGAEVVWGRCGGRAGTPAYWPWIQAIRALGGEHEFDGGSHSDAAEARFRLFDTIADFIRRAGAKRPLVLVLDDLHAADQSTLDLLEFIAPAVLDAPVLIVGTYRDTEADLSQSLRSTLDEIARTTDCLQLVLMGLSPEDTAHFVEVSASVTAMPNLTAALHETSSGNPFFVTELVRLLRAENRLRELDDGETLALPRGVEQVIARRVGHLSDACRTTICLASVVGRDFDIALLERAGGEDGDALLGHLDDAIAARVVELAGAGSFRFSHDLVRQALYASLGEGEQRRAHANVMRALEDLHASDPAPVVAALAHHASAALPLTEVAKAVQYLTLAGDAAADSAAPHEAADYYRRAARLAESNDLEPAALCELHLRLAEQLIAAADMQTAAAAIEKAELHAAGSPPDDQRDARLAVARAHLRLLDALAFDEDEIFEVIEGFRQRDDPAGEARAWGALVTLNCGRSNRLKGGEAADRMLACAKRAGSSTLVNQAMRSIGSNIALGAVPVDVGEQRLQALIAESDDGLTKARLTNCRATLASLRGRPDEARALVDEARSVCPPGLRADLESYLASNGSVIELRAGNAVRAAELGRISCEMLEREGLVRYVSSDGCYQVDALTALGKLDEAEHHLQRITPWAAADDADALMRQARCRARIALARGDLDAARSEAEFALETITTGDADAVDERAECLLLLAQIHRAAGNEPAAQQRASEAIAVADARGNVVLADAARELLSQAYAAA